MTIFSTSVSTLPYREDPRDSAANTAVEALRKGSADPGPLNQKKKKGTLVKKKCTYRDGPMVETQKENWFISSTWQCNNDANHFREDQHDLDANTAVEALNKGSADPGPLNQKKER